MWWQFNQVKSTYALTIHIKAKDRARTAELLHKVAEAMEKVTYRFSMEGREIWLVGFCTAGHLIPSPSHQGRVVVAGQDT